MAVDMSDTIETIEKIRYFNDMVDKLRDMEIPIETLIKEYGHKKCIKVLLNNTEYQREKISKGVEISDLNYGFFDRLVEFKKMYSLEEYPELWI